MRTWIAALRLVAVTSARASAADVVSEFQNRRTAVFAQFGLGTPLGYVGAEAEHMVTADSAFSAGVGYRRLIAGDLVCEAGNRYDACVMFHNDDGHNLIYTGIAVGYAF